MTKNNINPQKIEELLSRSIAEILPSKDALEKTLLSGKQITVYIGTDATGPALHLGHATNYMVLERFRQLGHKVIILIGDFTARIGDPSDKTAARVQLTREQVVKNTKTWLKQISPLINLKDKINPPEITYNHKWLSKLCLEDVIGLASNFTIQQMLERDMFEKRLKDGKPIFFHELFYPLMQGYDSVILNVDAELCGTDQTFNALMGRHLLKRLKNKEKFVITTTLLENPVTKEKMMSKSKGTGIYLNDEPKNMFGKIMAQPDENIIQLFIDCTYVSMEKIETIRKDLQSNKVNPKDIKMSLAFEITKIYHGEKEAQKAEELFIKQFKNKETPKDIPLISIECRLWNIIDLLAKTKLVSSNSEARRMIEQGGVKINDQRLTIEDFKNPIEVNSGMVIQVGKRKFVTIK